MPSMVHVWWVGGWMGHVSTTLTRATKTPRWVGQALVCVWWVGWWMGRVPMALPNPP